MTLYEAVQNLSTFNKSYTIYATTPWDRNSTVLVAEELQSGGVPAEAKKGGMKYLLEVSIALDVLDGWERNSKTRPTLEEKCQRLIRYAITDA